MNNVQQGPKVERDYEAAKTRALARLRQATWEATQYLVFEEVSEYVSDVLNEVASDEP